MWGNCFLPGRFMFVYHRKPTPHRKTTVIHQTEIKNKKERSWSGENCLMIMSWKTGWWSEKSQEGITKKLWRVHFPPQKVRTRQVTCSENDRTRLILRGGWAFNFHLFFRSITLWSQREMHTSDPEWSWPKASCRGSFRRSDRYIFNIHQTRPLKNQHIQNLLLKKNQSVPAIDYLCSRKRNRIDRLSGPREGCYGYGYGNSESKTLLYLQSPRHLQYLSSASHSPWETRYIYFHISSPAFRFLSETEITLLNKYVALILHREWNERNKSQNEYPKKRSQ